MDSCPHCERVFDKPRDNESNNRKHIDACKKKKAKGKKRKGRSLITKFYAKVPALDNSVTAGSLNLECVTGDNSVTAGSSNLECVTAADNLLTAMDED